MPDPFLEAVAASRALLMARALKLTANPADAEDLVQDTITQALGRRRPVKSVRAWLLVILENRWRRQHGSQAAVASLEMLSPRHAAEDEQGRLLRWAGPRPRRWQTPLE